MRAASPGGTRATPSANCSTLPYIPPLRRTPHAASPLPPMGPTAATRFHRPAPAQQSSAPSPRAPRATFRNTPPGHPPRAATHLHTPPHTILREPPHRHRLQHSLPSNTAAATVPRHLPVPHAFPHPHPQKRSRAPTEGGAARIMTVYGPYYRSGSRIRR